MTNIRNTNLRFNLNKEKHRRAWEHLQHMDKRIFKSHSNAAIDALNDYFDRYYKTKDDPYLETREREEQFVERIVTPERSWRSCSRSSARWSWTTSNQSSNEGWARRSPK